MALVSSIIVTVGVAVAAIMAPAPVVLGLVGLLLGLGVLLLNLIALIIVVNSSSCCCVGSKDTVGSHDRCGCGSGGGNWSVIGDEWCVVGGSGDKVVSRDIVLHLTSEEDLGERKTDRVTELIEVLVLPLSLSIHDFVVDILAVNDEIVLDVEDEVPRVSESLGHLTELVEIGADGGLALLELVGDVVDDFTHILDGVEDRVEGADLELIDDTTEALPDVLGITEALDTVRNLSLNGASKETLEDLAHSEEGEVDIRALHGLEVVHLLVLLVIDLVEKLLPVVAEVIEKFIMVNHLGLSVKEHGGGLAEVLASVEPLAHAVVVETLAGVLEDVNSVNDEGLSGLEENLLGVEEGLSHSLDLLIVVMIDLSTVIKHVTNIRDSETEGVDGLGGLLIRSIPEAAHGVLEMLLNRVGIRDTVCDISHAMEVEGTNKETLYEASNLGIVVSVVGVGSGSNESCSEILEHR